MAKALPAPRQYDLFGNLLDEPKAKQSLVRLPFGTNRIRVVIKDGQPWCVASDVCRALDLANPRQVLRRLPDRFKGVHQVDTLGGAQQMSVVNEQGAYMIAMRSDKPEALRFQEWLAEVAVCIRRDGRYELPRAEKVRRRLKTSDPATVEARIDQLDQNRGTHERLRAEGACPRDFAEWHNSGYRGQFGMEAAELRKSLGISKDATPLDHMTAVPLSLNKHAKALAERIIRDKGVPVEQQGEILQLVANEMSQADLSRLGSGYSYGMTETPDRGRVIDVVHQRSLLEASRAG